MPNTPLFLTGNRHKLSEFQQVWPELQSWAVDLPEIQDSDAKNVVRAKLIAAAQLKPGVSLIVEDTSLCLEAMGGLPGPLTKWFVSPDTLGIQGLAEIARERKNTRAEAVCWIGLLHITESQETLRYFKGVVSGNIVMPRGSLGFGWDPVFQPEGSDLTFAEMDKQQKMLYSMRQQAIQHLSAYLSAL